VQFEPGLFDAAESGLRDLEGLSDITFRGPPDPTTPAIIDGGFESHPFNLAGRRMRVEWLVFANSRGTLANFTGSSDCVVDRCVAWNDPAPPGVRVSGNHHIWGISQAKRLQMRVAGFGSARNTLVVHKSEDVTLRDSWLRVDGQPDGPRQDLAALAPAYLSRRVRVQNVACTASWSLDPKVLPPDYGGSYRLLKTDRPPLDDPAPGLSIEGLYLYAPDFARPSQLLGAIAQGTQENIDAVDVHVRVPDGARVASLTGSSRNTIRRMTWGRSSRRELFKVDWQSSDVYELLDDEVRLARRPALDSRFVQLIETCAQRSAWPDAHVQAGIERAFGPPVLAA